MNDKKLRKLINEIVDAKLNEVRQANVDCCQAWAAGKISGNQLVRAEMEKRFKFNRNLEKNVIFLSSTMGFIAFLVAGYYIPGDFIWKLIAGIVVGFAGLLLSFAFGYVVTILLEKNTSQTVVEKYVLGD